MLPKSPELKTARLTLRNFVQDDLASMLRIFYCDEVKQTYMLPDFPSEEKAVALFERFRACAEDPSRFDYAICLENRLIGFINDCGIEGDTVELGYVIHPEYKNQGYATEALTASIAEFFRMGFKCVQAAHFEENPASGRVMQKSGMTAIEKEETIEYRGKAHRCLYYEIKNA